MDYRQMGRTGLRVSELCLGSLTGDQMARLNSVSDKPLPYPYNWLNE